MAVRAEEGEARSAIRGFVTMETRAFTQSPAASEQARHGVSVAAQPEFSYESANRRHRFSAVLFGRSSANPRWSSADVRELNWQYRRNSWSLLAGVNRVFWGVTESRHVIDVINQSDM